MNKMFKVSSMKHIKALIVTFFIVMPGAAWAGERIVKFDIGAGLTFGGDELAYATFENGNTDKIRAGELLHIYGGLLFNIPNSPFSTRLAIGYHFDSISAENGNIEFTRKPLDIIPFYNLNKNNRIGVGLTYHLDPKLTSDILPDVMFDDTMGFLAEYGFGFADGKVWLALRYVNIDYDPTTIDGVSFQGKSMDGSHFGIYVQGAL